MKFQANVSINGTKEQIWHAITDIEESVNMIGAIEEIEILEKPASGIEGLKWRETRTMFGKSATEVMWITDAIENEYYQTRAENNGAVYISKLQIEEQRDGTQLSMEFSGEPQNGLAKIMSAATGLIFKKATQRALQEDLHDIKTFVEKTK